MIHGDTPDYPSAAAAWMSQQMTIECMRHNEQVIKIAYEYEKRLEEERKAAN